MSIKKNAKQDSQLRIDCGPTIEHVCRQYDMFTAIPPKLAELAADNGVIAALIVDQSSFVETRRQIDTNTGAYATLCRQAEKIIKTGGK